MLLNFSTLEYTRISVFIVTAKFPVIIKRPVIIALTEILGEQLSGLACCEAKVSLGY